MQNQPKCRSSCSEKESMNIFGTQFCCYMRPIEISTLQHIVQVLFVSWDNNLFPSANIWTSVSHQRTNENSTWRHRSMVESMSKINIINAPEISKRSCWMLLPLKLIVLHTICVGKQIYSNVKPKLLLQLRLNLNRCDIPVFWLLHMLIADRDTFRTIVFSVSAFVCVDRTRTKAFCSIYLYIAHAHTKV